MFPKLLYALTAAAVVHSLRLNARLSARLTALSTSEYNFYTRLECKFRSFTLVSSVFLGKSVVKPIQIVTDALGQITFPDNFYLHEREKNDIWFTR